MRDPRSWEDPSGTRMKPLGCGPGIRWEQRLEVGMFPVDQTRTQQKGRVLKVGSRSQSLYRLIPLTVSPTHYGQKTKSRR